MAKPTVHTVTNPKGGWDNKLSGTGKVISHTDTKVDAVGAGRTAAKQLHTEHVIHNTDGKISERNSYGNDPCPPKG